MLKTEESRNTKMSMLFRKMMAKHPNNQIQKMQLVTSGRTQMGAGQENRNCLFGNMCGNSLTEGGVPTLTRTGIAMTPKTYPR